MNILIQKKNSSAVYRVQNLYILQKAQCAISTVSGKNREKKRMINSQLGGLLTSVFSLPRIPQHKPIYTFPNCFDFGYLLCPSSYLALFHRRICQIISRGVPLVYYSPRTAFPAHRNFLIRETMKRQKKKEKLVNVTEREVSRLNMIDYRNTQIPTVDT